MESKEQFPTRPEAILDEKYFVNNAYDRELYSRFLDALKHISYLLKLSDPKNEEDIILLLQAKEDLNTYYTPQFKALKEKISEDILAPYLIFITLLSEKIETKLNKADNRVIRRVTRNFEERLGEILAQVGDD